MDEPAPDSERRYFTMLPNIADDSDLSACEFRLLAHYYRVGVCYEGIETTARLTNLSLGTVSHARRRLESKGWIVVDSSTRPMTITVADRWAENERAFRRKRQPEKRPAAPPAAGADAAAEARPSSGENRGVTPSAGEIVPATDEAMPSPAERQPSAGETKKNSLRRTSKKNEEEEGIRKDLHEMIQALAEATGRDPSLHHAALQSFARRLRRQEYTPGQIRVHYSRQAGATAWNWYEHDWRGRKGDWPTPKELLETIGGAVRWRPPAEDPSLQALMKALVQV